MDVWWSLRLRAGAEPDGWEIAEPREESEAGETAEATEATEAVEPAATAASDDETSDAASSEFDFPEPRRAVRLELPLERDASAWPPDRSRLNRRNMYRVLDRFSRRLDLS
jgi:hypothetical protein